MFQMWEVFQLDAVLFANLLGGLFVF